MLLHLLAFVFLIKARDSETDMDGKMGWDLFPSGPVDGIDWIYLKGNG